jgi:predicted branched-subunit amino acid permease
VAALRTTAPQYVTWALGTVVGVFAGDVIGDPARLGLDAIYPTFFLALLLAELRDRRSRTVAAVGSLIALALVPFAPPGVPILAAAAASLIALARPADREDA